MRTYLHQLQILAEEKNLDLKEAFLSAGISDSVYYRAINGAELKFSTAKRVAKSLEGA